MFIGLAAAVIVIIGYSIYADYKYATKSDLKELEIKLNELENKLTEK